MDKGFVDETLQGNEAIKEATHLFHRDQSEEHYMAACLAVRDCMDKDGHLIFPADVTQDEEGNTTFFFKTLDINGMNFLVAFTDQEEYEKAPATGAVSQFIDNMLENVLQQDDMSGVIINPWGEHLVLCKVDVEWILNKGVAQYDGES